MAQPGLQFEQGHRIAAVDELAGDRGPGTVVAGMLPRTSLLATPALRHRVGMMD